MIEHHKHSAKTINRSQWRVTPIEIGASTLILEVLGCESGPHDACRDEIVVEAPQLDQLIDIAKTPEEV